MGDFLKKITAVPGADLGGPLWEFLTLVMKNVAEVPGIFIGEKTNVFLKMLPESIQKGHYFMLGQLTRMAILRIGRGPECFNLTMIKAMFHHQIEDDIITFDEAELNDKINQVGNTDGLLELDILISAIMYLCIKS